MFQQNVYNLRSHENNFYGTCIVDIDFHKLLDIDFPESVEYYQNICDSLDIYANFEYYEQLHQTVNGKQFNVFVDNIVLQEVLDYYCENHK